MRLLTKPAVGPVDLLLQGNQGQHQHTTTLHTIEFTMFEKLQDWYRRDIPYSQLLSLAQGRLEGSWINSLEKVDVRQSSNNQLGISR